MDVSDSHENADRPQTLIGKNVERLLAKHDLTAKELAARSGSRLTGADISRIKNGQTPDPGISKARAIVETLGEPLDALWADPDAPANREPSLDAFLRSPLNADRPASDREILLMSTLRWTSGPAPSVTSWWHILQAIRASEITE